jgi:hypothetical protein
MDAGSFNEAKLGEGMDGPYAANYPYLPSTTFLYTLIVVYVYQGKGRPITYFPLPTSQRLLPSLLILSLASTRDFSGYT